MEQRAGLYKIGGIAPTTDSAGGMIIWVGSAGGSPVMRSFVWYPDGPPAAPRAFTSGIELRRELRPRWFLWNYDRRGR
jgi:hypothetical protein